MRSRVLPTPFAMPLASGLAWLIVGACGGEPITSPADDSDPNPTPVVDSISVEPGKHTIGMLGTDAVIVALALAADGDVLRASTTSPEWFTWSSSDPEVASVHETTCVFARDPRPCVRVTGLSEGTATITAAADGLSGSTTVTVRDRARLDWSIPTAPGTVVSATAVGPDGTIYVGADDPAVEQSLWTAVSPDGSRQWTLALPLTWHTHPAIGSDGTLYFASRLHSEPLESAGVLTAVTPDGTVRWALEGMEGIRASPAIGPDGTIYVVGGHDVYAVDPEGELLWTHESDSKTFVYSSPAVASDGTIYVGGTDGLLRAINADGSIRWTFEAGDAIDSSPAVGTDGTIYFGSRDGRVYAVHADGTGRWSVEVDPRNSGVFSSPSVGPDGTIYAGGGGVVAIGPDGTIRWSYPGSKVNTTPILGANGRVYVAAAGGITVLDANGQLVWNYTAGGHTSASPAIGIEGHVFLASYIDSPSGGWEGTLHALVETGSADAGYDVAPWPTERGYRSNSGWAGG